MRCALILKNSSGRLRRDSINAAKVGVSVRSTSSKVKVGGTGDRKTAAESDLGRVDVAVRQAGERHVSRQRQIEFRGGLADAGWNRVPILRIAPLRNVVILDPQHAQAVEIMRSGEGLDIGNV